MKLKIMRVLTWIGLRTRLYYVWAKIYRWLIERRKWKHIKIPPYQTIEEIESIAGRMTWRKDTWRVMGDTISLPEATFGRFLNGEPAGDCDDISLFAVHCIERLVNGGENPKGIGEIGLLTCPYIRDHGKGKVGGHNVGAFQYMVDNQLKWAWISNWHNGCTLWGFDSLEDVVKAVVADVDAASLGWAFATTKLKLIRCGNAV